MRIASSSRRLSSASLLAVVLLAGCASFAVSDDALVQRTGFALGLEPNQFTVSNRMDEGTTTRYRVNTTAGKVYNCSVGGSLSVIGKSVSSALCDEIGQNGAPDKPNCNALTKAAGKC
jgi:hypothetical protein